MQQPEPQSLSYETLLGDIAKGLVKIPRFQREFVWSRDKSAALIDSVLRGYPIGTFILWRTKESLRAVRNIGNAQLPSPPEGEYVNQVLDGQQRLTSLFATIRGLEVEREGGKAENFAHVLINLAASEDQSLVFVSDGPANGESTISVFDLVNQGFTFFGKYPAEHHAMLEKCQQRLKSYQFSTVLVRDAPIEVATEIFTRINEGGKPLTPFEIMVAKTYVDGKFDLAEACDRLTEELREVEFETIPSTVFLQAAAVILRNDCRKKTILSLPRDEFVSAWPAVEKAIKHAVDYLKMAYRIPASRLLPYPAMLVPITFWFHRRGKKPDGLAGQQLRSLFWRIGVDGTYSGATETEIAQDVRRVQQILDGHAPTYDEPPTPVTEDDVKDYGYFTTGRAFVRTILCMLAARGPESFDDGSKVIIDNDWLIQANSKNYHHFFPRAFLKKKGVESWQANHVANITIIDDRLNKAVIRDKPPSKYLKQFKANTKLAAVLRRHLIELNSDRLEEDDYEHFFRNRCRRIARELDKMIAVDVEADDA